MVKTRSTRDHSGEDTYDTEINTEYSEYFESSDECTADTTVVQRPFTRQSAPILNLKEENENSQKSEGQAGSPIRQLTRKSHRGRSSFPSAIKSPRRSNQPDILASDSDSESSGDEDRSPRVSKSKQQNSNRLPIFTRKEKWKVWFNRFEAVAHLLDTTKIYITRFNGRRQHADESVQNFAAELKMLHDKGYPHRDQRTR
ncbi:Hypothetical predicted protein [Mytilus galloprovincialis]|uniref:Retrotransposon gag domain-containing protein n=1 Tax=Mytilus galloprovincialis TaxID=29158 RepID=A0A8B6D4Z0_MYTGA|nr:Hypothetical predicted protein [Mytilus galloprovincialis]